MPPLTYAPWDGSNDRPLNAQSSGVHVCRFFSTSVPEKNWAAAAFQEAWHARAIWSEVTISWKSGLSKGAKEMKSLALHGAGWWSLNCRRRTPKNKKAYPVVSMFRLLHFPKEVTLAMCEAMTCWHYGTKYVWKCYRKLGNGMVGQIDPPLLYSLSWKLTLKGFRWKMRVAVARLSCSGPRYLHARCHGQVSVWVSSATSLSMSLGQTCTNKPISCSWWDVLWTFMTINNIYFRDLFPNCIVSKH